MTFFLVLPALLLGLFLGEKYPDIDQKLEFLQHRSILTHGLLTPAALYLFAAQTRSAPFRWAVIGASLGVAAHLAFDLFPRAWSGYALVSIPLYGWIPAPMSWAWIMGSSLACSYLAAKLVHGCWEASLWTVAVIAAFTYAAQGEAELWKPIAAGAAMAVTAMYLARRSTRKSNKSDS